MREILDAFIEPMLALLDGAVKSIRSFVVEEEPEIKVSKWSKRRDFLNYGPETGERHTEGIAPTEEEKQPGSVLGAEMNLRRLTREYHEAKQEAERSVRKAVREAEREAAYQDAMRARRNRMRRVRSSF